MIVKIFWQPACPHCTEAKRLGEILKKDGIKVELHNVQEANGLAETAFFNTLSTPSIAIADENKEVASWRNKIPSKEEIKKFFK